MQGACKLPDVICIYQWAEFNVTDFLRVKRRCQLVVRVKANKCYQELLRYLSSYINNVTNTTPGIVLIILLVILLWLLWPYCWSYCFDCIALIVFVLGSILCFLYHFYNCSSNCERLKTEFTTLINHALICNHLFGSINGHEPLDHLELCLDPFSFRHYLQVLGCKVASPTLRLVFKYQSEIIPYNKESNKRS